MASLEIHNGCRVYETLFLVHPRWQYPNFKSILLNVHAPCSSSRSSSMTGMGNLSTIVPPLRAQ